MLRQTALLLSLSVSATAGVAETPRVMTDIAPVQSLVARVMSGVGDPDVLLPPGASPHDFTLRPSDAARLAGADLVIWVGHSLTPWLEDPLTTLAGSAAQLELAETAGWAPLPLRSDEAFADADEHDAGEAAHDHAGMDPHAWLDPMVAAVWMSHIAESLAAADPANAATYRDNAAAAQQEMAALDADLQDRLAPFAGGRYIVPHDAYQYFETAFGMPATAAISLTDASTPGPARIAALRERVVAGDVTCILTDPQTSAAWTEVLRDGTLARTARVDPDGSSQIATAGNLPALYPAILTSLAAGLADCLRP